MPAPTYVAIAKTVLTGTQSTVTFSGIPSTYTDLILSVSVRADSGGTGMYFLLNNEATSATNASYTFIQGNGSSASSSRGSASVIFLERSLVPNTNTSNTFSSIDIYIPNYAGSANKIISTTQVLENNTASTDVYVVGQAGRHSTTSAITQLDFKTTSGNFVSGSRFDLYGIKNS